MDQSNIGYLYGGTVILGGALGYAMGGPALAAGVVTIPSLVAASRAVQVSFSLPSRLKKVVFLVTAIASYPLALYVNGLVSSRFGGYQIQIKEIWPSLKELLLHEIKPFILTALRIAGWLYLIMVTSLPILYSYPSTQT